MRFLIYLLGTIMGAATGAAMVFAALVFMPAEQIDVALATLRQVVESNLASVGEGAAAAPDGAVNDVPPAPTD